MNARALNVLVVAGLVAGSLGAGRAKATPVLDQEAPFLDAAINVMIPSESWQQEVVVGTTGTLTQVELYVRLPGYTPFSIHVGAPWQTGASDFLTPLVPAAPGWIAVDTSAANLQFSAGDHFVIGVIGSGTMLVLGGSYVPPTGGYPAGALWYNTFLWDQGNWDLAFRTYMEPAAVPAPGALALALLGVGSLIRLRRRRML